MSNGCGCESGVLKWLKPPYAKVFYTPCCMHDDDYDRGGNEQDRWIADRWLYNRMLKVIRQNYVQNHRVVTDKSSPWEILKLVMVANLYYASVRLFGRFYFNYTTDEEDNTMVQGKQ